MQSKIANTGKLIAVQLLLVSLCVSFVFAQTSAIQTVTIVTEPASASMTVYYTLDGTTPTTKSAVYAAPLTVNTLNSGPANVTVRVSLLNKTANPSSPVIGNLRVLTVKK